LIAAPLYTFHTLSALLIENFPKELLYLSQLLFIIGLLIFILQKSRNDFLKPLILTFYASFIPIFALQHQSIIIITFSILSSIPFLCCIFWSKTLLVIIGTCQILLLYWHRIKFSQQLFTASYEETVQEITNQTLVMCITSILNISFCLYFQGHLLGHEKNIATLQQKINILQEENLQQTKSQENLLLTLSHELNNPIYSISGSLDVMIKHSHFQDFQNITKKCQADIKFLHCLVSNILDFSKAQQNTIEICPHEVQTLIFFENLWASCDIYIKAKGLQSKLIFLTDLPVSVLMDYQRVTRIVLNLVSNSIKFTHSGFINCLISWEEKGNFRSSSPMLQENDGILRIEIVDTGSGISNHLIDKVLKNHGLLNQDAFPHDEASPLKLGLGLYVIKQVLDKMGGTISVVSEKGEGASFTVQIPCEKGAATASDKYGSQRQDSSQGIRKLKGLVVDDQPFNADINRTFLEKCGVEVLNIAKNGKEAVDYFEKELEAKRGIDVICMDIEMPIMNGKTAAERIREIEIKFNVAHCQIIFLSGNSVESEITECLDMNGSKKANFFLRKPVKINEFELVIQKIKSIHEL